MKVIQTANIMQDYQIQQLFLQNIFRSFDDFSHLWPFGAIICLGALPLQQSNIRIKYAIRLRQYFCWMKFEYYLSV